MTPSRRLLRSLRHPLALATAVLGTSACTSAYGPYPLEAPEPVVRRVAEDRLAIRWDRPEGSGPLRVYAGHSPDAIDRDTLITEMEGSELVLIPPDPEARWFFELVPEEGPSRIAGERLLPLEGVANFRDLGGYQTSDGRSVRWGLLYRSDDLSGLTREDLRYVQRLDINLVCDLRSDWEREREPNRLPREDAPAVANLPIEDDRFNPAKIGEMILSRSLAGVDFARMLIEGNRAFATRFTPEYASMFERIGQPGNLPALVHCSAGKDRTGFAAAILLLALGVPEETVMRDYLLSNVYREDEIARTLGLLRLWLLFQTPAEAIRDLLGVRPDYLEAGLAAVEEEYGSLDAYLRDGLGVTDAEREALRGLLLQ